MSKYVTVKIPICDDTMWKAVQKKYNLPDLEILDDAFCNAQIPKTWTIKVESSNQYGTHSVILNENKKSIGKIFVSNPNRQTPYGNNIGCTIFDEFLPSF